MQISKILEPGGVKVLGHSTSKKRLFQDLAEIASACYGVSAAVALDGLLERETLGPTGVGHGIALPHARIARLYAVIRVSEYLLTWQIAGCMRLIAIVSTH